MSYWKDTYGTASKDFINGVIAGLTGVAVWMNGKQYVSSPEILLQDEIKRVKQELGWNPDWDDQGGGA